MRKDINQIASNSGLPEMVEITEIYEKLSEGKSELDQAHLDKLLLLAALMAQELRVCRENTQTKADAPKK
mgnify:CR=1 FL=1